MNIDRITPSKDLQLNTKELQFFYNILLLCESNKGNPKGYDFGNKRLQKLLINKNFKINHTKQVLEKAQNNEINFTNNKNAICTSLLVHLRNAFAHGHIEKDTETNSLHFQDFFNNQCNMDGRMSFKNLHLLIETILQTKKK